MAGGGESGGGGRSRTWPTQTLTQPSTTSLPKPIFLETGPRVLQAGWEFQIPSVPWGHAHGPHCQSPGSEAQGCTPSAPVSAPFWQSPQSGHPVPIQATGSTLHQSDRGLLSAQLATPSFQRPSRPAAPLTQVRGPPRMLLRGPGTVAPLPPTPPPPFPDSATSPPATWHLALGCPPTCLPQSPPAAPLPHALVGALGSLTKVPPCPLHLPITPPGSDLDTCQSPASFHQTLPPSKPLLTADAPALPQPPRALSTSVL